MNFLNLKAVLSLNGSGFALGLKRAESASKQFAKEIKGQFAQAFGTAAIVAYGAKIVNMADNITDMAERLGMSTKSLQEWTYAAQKSGSTIERVTKFLEHLALAREKALGGDEESISSLNALGVTDFSQGADAIGRKIGKKIETGDFSRDALRKVGGLGAGELIPALKSMDELTEAAHKAGRVFDDELLESLKRIKNELQGISDMGSGPMAKVMVWLATGIKNGLAVIKIGIASLAALAGGVNVGGSFMDTMRSGWKEANRAFDEGFAEWEQQQKSIKDAAEERAKAANPDPETDQYGLSGKRQIDMGKLGLHNVTLEKAAVKAAQSTIQSPSLTSWQSAGAAIRFSPEKKTLDDIAKNTRETAQNTRPANQGANNITGLGGELQ